jgi:hypothetical protein
MSKNEKGYPVLKGALVPAAFVGGGIYLGSLMGGSASRAVLNTPGMQQYLQRATPAQKKRLVSRIATASRGFGGVAGGAISAISYKILQDELKKKDAEKTAMFLACFDELRRLG